jgi:hypothetical protein
MTEHIITISDDGDMQLIYSDDLLELLDEGEAQVKRASDVEPDGQGNWQADMAKSGGPVLTGFKRRADALAAEVAWLQEHVLA